MAAPGDAALAREPALVGARLRPNVGRAAEIIVPLLSIAAALALWEAVSRAGIISERDVPAMSDAFRELWSMIKTGEFWHQLGDTVRGWALGLGIATALAVPLGILLGSSDF